MPDREKTANKIYGGCRMFGKRICSLLMIKKQQEKQLTANDFYMTNDGSIMGKLQKDAHYIRKVGD